MTSQYAEIAKRAYSIWETEGRPNGRDLEHWFRAEGELEPSEPGVTATPPNPPLKQPRSPRSRSRRKPISS